jgi:tRNA threonylcarbamoyladenosine biosynthesis protein TsaB
MLTLAVDTAAEIGSIALADRNGIREEIRLCAPGGFAQTLFGEIEALLACCQVRLADIELYAAASGPGSFTGVRIGLAAIKGLAEVAGKPAIGISNLEALEQFGSADLRAPIIDARRGEVFAAVLDREGHEVVPASVLKVQAFLELVGTRPVEFISAGFDPGRPFTAAPPELAAAIARLAIDRCLAGDLCDPASIEANYVRRSDAELFLKE